MRSKIALVIAALGGFTTAFGQKSVTVTVPEDADIVLFSAKGLPSAAPIDPLRPKAGTGTLNLKEGDDRVFAWNQKTGNVAVADAASVVADGWTPKPGDYRWIGQADISVETSGKPVAAGTVEAKALGRTQSQLIDPSSNGKASFFLLKPGKLEVKVTYRAGASGGKSVTQIFDITLDRAEPVPVFRVSVPDAVPTAGPASSSTSGAPNVPGTAGADATAKKPEAANPIGSFIVYLVALGAAVAVGFGVMRYMKQNPDSVTSKLEQLGVQVPKPGDEPLTDPGPVPMAAAPKPQPVQKIVLDDADPVPMAAPIAAPLAVPSLSYGEPTLVSDSGIPLPVMDGETVVGREAGLGLSLTGESTVSRAHARLMRSGADVTVTDLGSTNGTFVNGQPVSGTVTLRPGDAVQFGAVKFRYEA